MSQSKTARNEALLMRRLVNLKVKGVSVAEHTSEFQNLVNRLATIKMELDDEMQALLLLSSLPDSWETLVVSFSNSAPEGKLTMSMVTNALFSEEARKKDMSGDQSHALVTENRNREELLAEEGFTGRRSKMSARTSFRSEAASMPHYSNRYQDKSSSSSCVKKTERAKSDLPRISFDSSKDFQGSEIVEIGVEDGKGYKDTYSNEMYSPGRSKSKYSGGVGERERPKSRKSLKKPENSYSRSNSSQNSKSIDDSRRRRQAEIGQNVVEPALDEAAVRALISILSGYIKHFLKDKDFRTALHHNCFASLNFVELEEGLMTESKVLSNLEQAIETVERAAEERASAKELKKASLQLGVITGFNSDDLKDGFTSGIPNSKLSACAHLYLSVIYKLQKKDRIAAKHLLQVFCDSSFQARMMLLPELWDYLFLPHLSHLKAWYIQEADSLADTSIKSRKLKLLEKVYNEIMDSGTYQFAFYYKDWLTEGVEAPSIPSIHIPSISVRGIQKEYLQSHSVQEVHQERWFGHSLDVGSPTGPFSPQPMVSKRLYEAVFGHSNKPGANEVVEHYKGSENFDATSISSDGSAIEDKQALTCSSGKVKHMDQDIERDNAFHLCLHAFLPVELNGNFENIDEESSCSSIPRDFICPLTGLLFEDPVTLETGQTFERAAITEWFKQGYRTCPVTEKTLESQSVPHTNFILKRVIDSWKSVRCRHLLAFASQQEGEHRPKLEAERAAFILQHLLTSFSKEERITNAKLLMSLGGLQFLVRRFDSGNLTEKTTVAALFSSCIEADNGCRNYIARNIKKPCLLELIHSKQVKSRENAVLLLTELICLDRRKDVNFFLSGFQNEGMLDTMHVLLVYLQSSLPEQRPLVAVLLLHLDLLALGRGRDPTVLSLWSRLLWFWGRLLFPDCALSLVLQSTPLVFSDWALSARRISGWFGLTQKGYRCYDPISRQLYVSYHVAFLEHLSYFQLPSLIAPVSKADLVLIDPFLSKNLVGCKWVYKVKTYSDGCLECYKAHLVAKGFSQEYDIDYKETFATVAKMTTVRTLISIAVVRHWPLYQMDVKNAFLDVHLTEEVYMHPPLVFLIHSSGLVCRLRRALYSLKQSPRTCFEASAMSEVKQHLLRTFEMKDLGPLRLTLPIPLDNPTLYRELVGCLVYLTVTHPDLAYVVYVVSQLVFALCSPYWAALIQILHYLHDTIFQRLVLSSTSSLDLVTYANADWVSDVTDCKSTSGFCLFLGDFLISWKNKKQTVVTRSTAEAEYGAIAHATAEVEPRKYSIYREEAVDAITVALDGSLYNEKIRAKCCRALLILGGRFSSSGKIMIEDWILKQTGFLDGSDPNSLENEEDGVLVDEIIPSECRVLLMTIAEELAVPLRSLAEVTWTAKELYATISGGDS
ncbi:hypothetical protein HYC85_031016 [Camellia sinensis]|uniref:RING-type E3 ubiquitin transferase n=1 Tax=Camellia sinensis TaxID=4442 RepID=A0A7J7FPP6_CAMSI|nr:hypothetical protein HYC85_031016 [Camellia sinensis]